MTSPALRDGLDDGPSRGEELDDGSSSKPATKPDDGFFQGEGLDDGFPKLQQNLTMVSPEERGLTMASPQN